MYVVGGFDPQGRLSTEMFQFDVKADLWTQVKFPQGNIEGRAYSAACTVGVATQLFTSTKYRAKIGREGIYIFGGVVAAGISGTLAVLSEHKEEHSYEKAKTTGEEPCARYQHTMNYCEALNALVIYGGKNDSMLKYGEEATVLNDLYILPLETMTWVRVDTDRPLERRARHSADILGEKLYVFGGIDGSSVPLSTGFVAKLSTIVACTDDIDGTKRPINKIASGARTELQSTWNFHYRPFGQ